METQAQIFCRSVVGEPNALRNTYLLAGAIAMTEFVACPVSWVREWVAWLVRFRDGTSALRVGAHSGMWRDFPRYSLVIVPRFERAQDWRC